MPHFSKTDLKQELRGHCGAGYRLETTNSRKENANKQRKRALLCLGAVALNLFSGAFNQAVAGPRDFHHQRTHKAEVTNPFQGVIKNVEASLHEAMPETKGKITILDPFKSTNSEVRRIEKELDLTSDNPFEEHLDFVNKHAEEYGIQGKAYPYYNDEGETVCIASVVDTSRSPEDLMNTLLHEVGHCLDSGRVTPDYMNISALEKETFRRTTEAFADVFAHSMLEINGSDSHIQHHSIATRDINALGGTAYYDTGDLLLQVQQREAETSYDQTKITGWKEALSEAHTIINASDFSDDAYISRSLHDEAIRNTIRGVEGDTRSDQIENTMHYFRERTDVSNKIRRLVAGYDYIHGHTDEVRDFEPLDITLEQSMARALIHYQNSNDNKDYKMAYVYANHLRSQTFNFENALDEDAYHPMLTRVLLDDLLNNPDIVQEIADGKTTLEDLKERGLENTTPSIYYDPIDLSYNTKTSHQWGESILASSFNKSAQEQAQKLEQGQSNKQKITISFTSMMG